MYPAFLALLLPLIRTKMGLSNTLAGSLDTIPLAPLMRDPPHAARADAH